MKLLGLFIIIAIFIAIIIKVNSQNIPLASENAVNFLKNDTLTNNIFNVFNMLKSVTEFFSVLIIKFVSISDNIKLIYNNTSYLYNCIKWVIIIIIITFTLKKVTEIIKCVKYIFKQLFYSINYIYYSLKRIFIYDKPVNTKLSLEDILKLNKKFKNRFQYTFNNFQWNGDMYNILNILNTQLQRYSTSEKKIEFLTTTLYAANHNILNIINDNNIHKIKRVIKEPLVAFSKFYKFQKVVKKIIGWIHILKNIEVRFYKHLENRIRYNISSIPYRLNDDPNVGIIKNIKNKKNTPLPIIKLTNLLNNKKELPTKDELIRYLKYISEQDIANIYNVSQKIIKQLIKKYAINYKL